MNLPRPLILALAAGCHESTFLDLDPAPIASIRSHADQEVVQSGTITVLWGMARDEGAEVDAVQATWSLNGSVLCDPASPSDAGISRCEAPIEAGLLALEVTSGGRVSRDEVTLVTDPVDGETDADGLVVPGDSATDEAGDGDGSGSGSGSGAGSGSEADAVEPGDCAPPLVWDRAPWALGAVRLDAVAWRSDGDLAWLLGEDRVFSYDPATQTIAEVADAGGDAWTAIAADGDRLWIGGSSGSSPLLRPLDASGLGDAVPAAGVGSGRLPSGTTVRSIARSPWDGRLALLADDGQGSTARSWGSIYDPATDAWVSTGSGLTPQGAASITWGRPTGTPLLLAVGRETTLLTWAGVSFETTETPGTGNLRRALFDPSGATAWVMSWSGQGAAYRWSGSLETRGALHFDGWDLEDWATDGASGLFVGRAGQAWWVPAAFGAPGQQDAVDVSVTGWTSSPWSASTNHALRSLAWRPGSCEGIAVGDAAGGSAIVARFTLSR
jgi:hypothetical protein